MEAVVLLGGGEAALAPLTACPALLSLGTAPLVEYTLRWLETNGASEVHLVTCTGANELETYVKKAGWAGGSRRGMAVHVRAAPGCQTEGEALRFLEQEDVIKGDFVLVSGGVIANLDLRPAVQAHLARRAANRQAIMTLLVHGAVTGGNTAASSPSDNRWMVALDSHSQQLLKLEPSSVAGHAVSLGTHTFSERNSITVHSAIQQSSVYICAPDVLMLLSDNFDYQSISGDLVPGVLSEQELGSTIYIHEFVRGYVECICSLAGCAKVLEDVISRWAYPWAPDNTGGEQESCRFNRGAYVDASAAVASGCTVSKGSLVGRGSIIDAGVHLDHCIVGNDCHIGRNTAMQGSFLQSHVRVEEDCQLSSAMLAEQVVVRSHARLETGSMLANHTVIDSAHCVPAGMRVSLSQQHTSGGAGSEDELEWRCTGTGHSAAVVEAAAVALAAGGIPEMAISFDEHAVGAFGAGFAWQGPAVQVHDVLPFPVWFQTARSDCDSEGGDFTRDALAADDLDVEEHADSTDQFKREVAETFLRCIKERISHDNAVIELNGLKIAEDRTFADCARYIFTTMLSLCLPASMPVKSEFHGLFPETSLDVRTKGGRLELLRRVNTQLKSWKQLLHRFLKSSDDQVELLLTFEEFCAEEGDFSSGEHGSLFAELFPQIVKLCYDHDLLNEEAILDWAREKENASSEDRQFVEMCADLLAWLEDAEEESGEDVD